MRKRKEIRDYYTWWEIYIAWIKKLFKIKSSSAIRVSQGKYVYAYDFMVKKENGGQDYERQDQESSSR